MNTNKAPDKLYFPADGLPAYIDWDGSPIRTVPIKDCNPICYIRKDALLEWAKEHYTSLDITQRDMWDGGYNYAMKELIEYLQSL